MGDHLVYRTADVIARRHSSAVKRMTRLRHAIMGSRHILAAGAALAWVPAAIAQDAAPTQPPPPGSLQGFQLDPNRDTSRPRPPEKEGPEIDNRPGAPLPTTPAPANPAPTVATPPPVSRTVQPTPAPSPAAQQPANQQPARQPAPQARTPTPAQAPEQPVPAQSGSAPSTQAEPAAPPAAEPPATATPLPAGNATAEAGASPVPVETPSSSNLPWIIAALAAAVIAGMVFFIRRRARPTDELVEEEIVHASAAPPRPAPAHQAAEPETAEPVQTARPNAALSIEFRPLGARHTLIGAAVGYRIILHNEGEVAAENVAIASMIANADARQEQELAGFFAQPVHAPSHSAERIEPGFAVEFTGELRLASNAIVPIQVRDRALLIPLVAFSAHYEWEGGNGYSAAAFIVGEESDPPRERMAPFRLDQGPRQYRSVGSRPARTALVG